MAVNNSMYQLENLVIGLLEALNDKHTEVQDAISASLVDLGKKRTDFILNIIKTFTNKNLPKLTDSQRVCILNSVQKIIKEKIDDLEEQTAIGLIELASVEMIHQKEPSVVAIQIAASSVLVTIGVKYVKHVYTELLKQFHPGALPHIFILNTMANLAEVNAYGVVPQLSSVLASMLPMLGMTKLDSYKCAFASALCKFSEAILYYCSNKEKAPDQSIERTTFSTQIYAAHEVFFNVWIKTSDNKLRQVIIEAIGFFVNLIPNEKLESDLPKILTGVLGLYKKHPDHQIVSQALCMIITATNESNILSIELLLETLLKELLSQTLSSVEQAQSNPNAIKNQNEILRCFTQLANRFCDKLLPFILIKFEQNNERMRITALIILKHLINSSSAQMSNKRELVLSGLRLLLTDTNNKVKRQLIQTIISMAYHGYLQLEGGGLMIEFILKQCAIQNTDAAQQQQQKGNKDSEHVDNEQLRSMAENVLTLFTTTVENMHTVLWPFLFEYLTNGDYTRAISNICKSLAYIAEQKRELKADDYLIDFNQMINLPKTYDIFARLFIVSGVPLLSKNRGLNSLNLMKNISVLIHDSIATLWDNILPKLTLNLEDQINNNKFEQKKWEELLLKMLAKSIECIADENEICEYGAAFGRQIQTLSNSSPEEKHFAYKCLGIISSKTENKSFIDKQLTLMFQSVNHVLQVERDGCAIGFGYCSSVHLDTVLQKLEVFAKNETKKSTGLFSNILKDSKTSDPELIKATLVLCYGYVTLYAPEELIISRLEANILRSVTGFATNAKDLTLRQNSLKSLEIITKCMHSDHLQKDFNFSYRPNLMELTMGFVVSEGSNKLQTDVKAMCYKVASNLVKLNPKPSDADVFSLVKTVTDSFFPLAPPAVADDKSDKKRQLDGLLHGSQLFETTVAALETLLNDVLRRNLNSNGLVNIYKHCEPWITSMNDHERERVSRVVASLLSFYAKNYKLDEAVECKQVFECFGSILGRLVPRTTDPVIQIRVNYVSTIESLLNTLVIYNSYDLDQLEEEKQNVKALHAIGDKLQSNDSNTLLLSVNELSKVIGKRIPYEQLFEFIEKLIEGLLDVQSHCSSSACIVLNYCVKLRGKELEPHIDSLLRHLYSKLSLIQSQQTKLGALRTIRTIFQMHLIESLNVILTFPIPCTNDLIDICKMLGEDSELISNIIEHILQTWQRCLPYEEKMNTKYASLTPLVGTCLLTEIFTHNTSAGTEQVLIKSFEKIFSSLLVRVASTLNNQMPLPRNKEDINDTPTKQQELKNVKQTINAEYKKLDPIKISIECFKSFIKATKSVELEEYYENESLWSKLGDDSTHIEACFTLARGLCLHGTQYIVNVVNNLLGFLTSPYDCHKVCVTAFFCELMNNKCVVDLIELLMNNLLSKLIDPCTTVRTLCIKGLGNISSLGSDEVQRHSTTILSAMMAGLDDRDDLNDDITVESMDGLSKIIALIDENNVRPILINILLRIRPCFEKDKPSIRSSSYILFGKLSRFGRGPSRDPFIEQIHSNFVSFILHLNENDSTIKKSCKYTLKQVGPLLESENLNDLFEKALLDDVPLHYGEFINNLSKVLINDFPEKISFYIMNSVSNFKSQWAEIRSNAVLFAGYLLGNLSKDKQSVLSKEHISNALIKLLKEDPSAAVRCKAADAMSLLHDF